MLKELFVSHVGAASQLFAASWWCMALVHGFQRSKVEDLPPMFELAPPPYRFKFRAQGSR